MWRLCWRRLSFADCSFVSLLLLLLFYYWHYLQVPDSVLLLCSRDPTRGQTSVDGVIAKMGDGVKERLKLVVLDVTSDASVEAALAKVPR